MRVRFWGTRGSIPKPGPSTTHYGGNTSCTEARSSSGTLVILDCGTGAHSLGQHLIATDGKALCGHILISHTHWDHIQGLPFFAPLFAPGSEWHIYGPKGLHQSMRETLAGQMQYTYFPITPDQFEATVHYHDLVEGIFRIGDIKVIAHYLNHPALTLGYRLEADDASVVYSCDHEPHSRKLADGEGDVIGQDLRHADFIRNADLLIHDAQYTAAEYPSKMGWGHSSIEYAIKLSQYAGVKRLALSHHDPLRDDAAIDRLIEKIKGTLQSAASPLQVFAAAEGEVVEVEPAPHNDSQSSGAQFPAMASIDLADRSVLINVGNPGIAAMLSDVVQADGMRSVFFSGADEAVKAIERGRPSLVLIEDDREADDGTRTCRALRQKDRDVPLIMVTSQKDPAAWAHAGITDCLIKPFTSSYARTRIRAWVMRTECRWIRAKTPHDEEERLAALRELRILDTEPEDRFDRVARLAAALFDVPMAVISLVDEDRQWFKSCLGFSSNGSSRDAAFCAHVVYNREPLIVPDAFQDDRFADNPFVVNEPRIRFYAGYPLILDNGSCIGTLCLLDQRPRTLTDSDLERLHDLANIALREITA
jgi:phosphoribosyl 1,2-cyclic phosphodiesterase/CheY-like chemotaxis protein